MRAVTARSVRFLFVGIVAAGVVAAAGWAYVIACGPFLEPLDTVMERRPARLEPFYRGELGVVRPRFERAYLVEAYRVIGGRSPSGAAAVPLVAGVDATAAPTLPIDEWRELRDRVLGTTDTEQQHPFSQDRDIGDYQTFWNCTDDALRQAVRTLRSRVEQFGIGSIEARDWTAAQVAVFRNCSETVLVRPAALPASAHPRLRADRAYQTAAALFYAMEYDEAARQFEAIAADRSSEWQPFGRYLAARARLRRSTIAESDVAAIERLQAAAEADLVATIADPRAAALHRSARGLLDFVAARRHPAERLRALGRSLASPATPTKQELIDYEWLLRRVDVSARSADDDLTDWIGTTQGAGAQSVSHAIERWQTTRSAAWLVAALWQLQAPHPAAEDLLAVASAVDRRSPAFATLAFLRVRLLARLGRVDAARALLASLPTGPETGVDVEAINLIKAERFMLAESFEELLASAPRTVVREVTPGAPKTSFDADAAITFTTRLPLDALATAASSSLLPPRLRIRVASAALARAIVLRREDAGVRAARALRPLAPALAADLDRYLRAATPAARHAAGIFFLLRTPGAHTYVRGLDDDLTYAAAEPARRFDHLLRRNWWCEYAEVRDARSRSELTTLLYPESATAGPAEMPFPSFVSADARATVAAELEQLRAAGAGRRYLARETLAWARTDPRDANLPEALALVVEGWRWSCGDAEQWDLARQAFDVLHRRYGRSDWATRTKYWYRD